MTYGKDGTGTPDEAGVPGWDEQLGTRLRSVVRMLGGNEAAGRIAGVSDEMISRYVNGKAKPNFFAVAALARAAGVDLNWLASGEGDGQSPKAPPRDDARSSTSLLDKLTAGLSHRIDDVGEGQTPDRREPGRASAPNAEANAVEKEVREHVALLSLLVEETDRVYKAENARASTLDLFNLAVNARERIIAITHKTDHWPALVEMVLAELRDDLRKAPVAGTPSKRQA